jgi:hypothetical protein
MIFWVLVAILAVAYGLWYAVQPPEKKAEMRKRSLANQQARQKQVAARKAASAPVPISQIGIRTGGGLACPRCGGTNFKARRSTKGRAGIVGATLLTGGLLGTAAGAGLTKQAWVTCITCGSLFGRG